MLTDLGSSYTFPYSGGRSTLWIHQVLHSDSEAAHILGPRVAREGNPSPIPLRTTAIDRATTGTLMSSYLDSD